MNTLKVRAHAAPWNKAVEFLAVDGNAVAEPLLMKERDPGQRCEPTFSLDYSEAQTLMDDLWQAGLRPTEGAGSAGAFAAQGKHLEDMRRLVFEAHTTATK
jgi:hypothetical protein